MSFLLQIFVPFALPFPISPQELHEAFDKSYSEILDLEIEIDVAGTGYIAMKQVAHEEWPLAVNEVSPWVPKEAGSGRHYKLIEFRLEDDSTEELIKEKFKLVHGEDSSEHAYGLYISYALGELKNRVAEIILAANIARPGSIQTGEDVGFLNGKIYYHNLSVHSSEGRITDVLWLTYEDAHKFGWPLISHMSVKLVWDWLNKFEGLRSGIISGKVGRALAALSCIIESRNNDADLEIVMWSLVGVEAIFSKGNSQIQQQVIENTQLLLGPKQSYKQHLSKMYDFRSRFIHGEMDIPLAFNRDEFHDEDRFGKKHLTPFQSATIALSILLATLQKLVLNSWTSIEFIHTSEIQGQ